MSTARRVLIALLLATACAPLPESTGDLPPCAMLRRQICGADDQCLAPTTDDECEQCKATLCAWVRQLEENGQQLECAAEWRSRPAYPVCRFPGPVPTPPTPPFVYPIYCERECSLIPYPPKPKWAP
ncbi:MAG: hypothetical protein HY904_21505 [Deltaproteobacteria bacterium]|nr:hypothetical protein [Deltaproteobacteria bacterium]